MWRKLTSWGEIVSQEPINSDARARHDLEMFASIAGSLAIIEDLSVHTFIKDEEPWAFSIDGEGEACFEDEDLTETEDLLYELLAADLASNSWDTIEEESSEEGDSQFTWYFEIPLIESFKEPESLAKLLALSSAEASELSGFEARKSRFYPLGLERIAALLSCKHEFEDPDSFDETCVKCQNTLWDPSLFIETFQ